MRITGLFTSVVAALSWSAIAAAQTLPQAGTSGSAASANAALAQQPSAQQPAAQQVANTGFDTSERWFASGFLGPNFGSGGSVALTNPNTGTTISGFESGRDLSINFGGEVGYAFNGWIGAE